MERGLADSIRFAAGARSQPPSHFHHPWHNAFIKRGLLWASPADGVALAAGSSQPCILAAALHTSVRGASLETYHASRSGLVSVEGHADRRPLVAKGVASQVHEELADV